MKRIGIIGSSCNPPHLGHRQVAEAAKEQLDLDEVWLWVSFNIFKDPSVYAPLEHRVQMTQMLIEDRLWLKAVDIEKDFSDTMTATSLTLLQTLYPQNRFTWIFGDDNFASFHNWNRERFQIDETTVPDWQYILNRFSVAVMNRIGYHEAAVESVAAEYGRHLFIEDPKNLGHTQGWSFIDHEALPISSSDIKKELVSGKRSVFGLPLQIENYIYENGLHGTRADFNGAAQIPVPKNEVPYETFLLLASTANLVKTVGLHNGAFDSEVLLNHAAQSWDKSFYKSDFQKKGEVPGEIADCLISLYWLASINRIPLSAEGKENQSSVTEWCDLHYPDRGVEQRMMDYLEELAELCSCEGMERQRFLNLLTLVFEDPEADELNAAFGKNYEFIQVYAHNAADSIGTVLDQKMTVNRARTTMQSAQRLSKKEQTMGREPI